MKALLSLLLFFSCAHKTKPLEVSSWGIQLQGYEKNDSLKKIRESKKDLWVIDPDPFSSSMVKTLRGPEKKVIAYLSIGEAEGYRGYFKDMPKEIVLEENPDWKENYSVKFWDPRWQEIVLSQLDIIQNKGFDGVFLDVIDAFERFPDKKQKAEAMAKLIEEISKKARSRNPDFVLIMQNGIQIRRHLSAPQKLAEVISAINVESIFKERGDQLSQDLAFYRDQGVVILGLEYLTDPQEKKAYLDYAHAQGIKPLFSGKNLDGTAPAYHP